jgi:hypothetical protein
MTKKLDQFDHLHHMASDTQTPSSKHWVRCPFFARVLYLNFVSGLRLEICSLVCMLQKLLVEDALGIVPAKVCQGYRSCSQRQLALIQAPPSHPDPQYTVVL